MTFAITSQCISSHSCFEECTSDAILEGDGQMVIDPRRCIDCGDCLAACPVDAIVKGMSASAATLKFNKSESERLRKK